MTLTVIVGQVPDLPNALDRNGRSGTCPTV